MALTGIGTVREHEQPDMFDRETVERLAFEADWFETVKWMSERPEAYLQGVRNGFVAVDAKGEKETKLVIIPNGSWCELITPKSKIILPGVRGDHPSW